MEVKNEILNNQIKNILDAGLKNNTFQYLNHADIDLIAQIASNFKLNPNSNSNKEMLFVAAPTGAGKDTLVRKLTSHNPDKNYVVLNMDMFRHYYTDINKQVENISDKDFALKTNEISYEIYYLIEELILNYYPGTNVILTGTMKDTPWIESIFRKYKNYKYDISLSVLAVPYQESAFSIFERYLNVVETQLHSKTPDHSIIRYTDLTYHDETFENFQKSLEHFENIMKASPEELVNSISVYKRDKSVHDLSEDTLIFSSKNHSLENSATSVTKSVLNSKNEISAERFNTLLTLVANNKDYLQEQGLFKEIGKSLNFVHSLENKTFSEIQKTTEDVGFDYE